MKFIKFCFYSTIAFAILFQACKTKKLAQKPVAKVADTAKMPVTVAASTPKTEPAESSAAAAAPAPADKTDYSFSNIQFEFDSGILKTDSYPILDNAAAAMKAEPSIKFILKGYASAEGTDEHNMKLSVERANAVKAYLINSGVNPDNVTAKGFGESNPVADNTSEAGRILNRRVEIRKF